MNLGAALIVLLEATREMVDDPEIRRARKRVEQRAEALRLKAERNAVPKFDEDELELFEGRPHFLHSHDCPGYCDYACNGERGFSLAAKIAKARGVK